MTQPTRECSKCGYRGIDVHEYPTYSRILDRDVTDYFCKDIEACLDRVEVKE
ncbi:hypothetical protein LCGC14_2590240 [marine sediment metagenome]|uniref:Uncharacterized protein n=1 Tax=marine sediment metagenome TaxID=412755 RepID=A0A0F9ABU0_9ZZZZ